MTLGSILKIKSWQNSENLVGVNPRLELRPAPAAPGVCMRGTFFAASHMKASACGLHPCNETRKQGTVFKSRTMFACAEEGKMQARAARGRPVLRRRPSL